MPFYHKLGKVPPKRHTQFRKENGELYYEQLFGTIGFLDNNLNKPSFFFLKGKYLDGFLFNSEYKLKKFLTILSSKE